MFKYDGDNKTLIKATEKSNDVELLNFVLNAIENHDGFDMSTVSPKYLISVLHNAFNKNTLNIEIYYPKWRFSKAVGYFTPDKKDTIFINGYKTNNSIAFFVGVFYHEFCHFVDDLDVVNTFGHGDNSSKGKGNTVPYWIGNTAKSRLELFDYNDTSTGVIKYYISWYRRLWNFMRW